MEPQNNPISIDTSNIPVTEDVNTYDNSEFHACEVIDSADDHDIIEAFEPTLELPAELPDEVELVLAPEQIVTSADLDDVIVDVQSTEKPLDDCSSHEAAIYHYSDKTSSPDESQNVTEPEQPQKKKKHSLKNSLINGFLVFFAVLGAVYLVLVYSSNTYITRFRNAYIQTAMATLNHKYLATALFPGNVIDDLLRLQYESDANAMGVQSNWGAIVVEALPTFSDSSESDDSKEQDETDDNQALEDSGFSYQTIDETESGADHDYSCKDEEIFFQLFYELDFKSVHNYLDKHPDALDKGWANININEAGLDDEGTSIETIHGDQVLAINAAKGIVLIRVNINASRGIMAICKYTERLSLCAAETLGTIGQTVGRICSANDGIVAISGSAFFDDGTDNGGQLSGLAVCSGTVYGSRLGDTDKRIELRNDNKMYIVDSIAELDENTRDASEFRPALIVDGEIVADENCGWTGPNPRNVIGQTDKLETIMFVLEGRLADSPGDSVVSIANVMKEYGCVQALNLDGGTSAIMYYDGEYVSRCSNLALTSGRTVPTAWVYH